MMTFYFTQEEYDAEMAYPKKHKWNDIDNAHPATVYFCGEWIKDNGEW